MKSGRKHIGIWMLLLSSAAAAQNTTARLTLQDMSVALEGSQARIEVGLSSPVTPSDELAARPDRIVLDFAGTTCPQKILKEVNAGGVRMVRVAPHSAVPPITRLVIELDQPRSYTVTASGNRVVITVGTAITASRGKGGAPAAATSGNLIGIFHRKKASRPASSDESASAPGLPAPPPATAPATAASDSQTSSGIAREHVPSTSSVIVDPAQSPAVQPAPQQPQATSANTMPSVAPMSARSSTPIVSPDIAAAPTPPAEAKTATPAMPVIAAAPNASVSAAAISANNSVPSAPPEAPKPNPAASEPAIAIARTDDPSLHTVFKVKYVAEGIAYLDGGRAQGLTEGMKLEILDNDTPARQGESANAADPHIVAELQVSAIAETSAVTDIHSPKRPVKVGDLAYLSSADADALVQQRTLSSTRQYPAVISFTEEDLLDQEARDEVPKPPPPSVNRARGRIGLDYMDTIAHGTSNVSSSDVGMVFRGDITRIGGSYWSLSGYWRGRLTQTAATSQPTLQDLINRTYHLNMTYDNPNSDFVAGFGRLYLPWAPSLDTIDGGYFGDRISKGTTLGIFGGSTPDPSSWDYSPDRVIGGAFINFNGGSYDAFHYSSTSGAGVSMVNWALDRPFIFFEDTLSWRRTFAIYESAQLDDPQGNSVTRSPGPGLGRNFFTFRVTPHPRIELDANYNYFRDIPTFNPTLVGTGLLDKYLFQGFSAGGRLEVLKQVFVSTNFGRSSGTGDSKSSLNQMYGLTVGRIPFRLRADAHYARFNSSFGNGSYESVSVSRQVTDTLRIEALLGQQNFISALTTNNRSRFLTSTVETVLGPHYYLQTNFTVNRGQFSYNQYMFSIGYRFDTRQKHRE